VGSGTSRLGSPVPVLGVSVPQLRGVSSAFRKNHRNLEPDGLNSLAAALSRGPTCEEKALAIELLNGYAKRLNDASWQLLDSWADEASGWGLCDWIGLGPVSTMVKAQPTRFRELLRWTKSENLWRRRIAVYGLRDFVFAGELDKPFRLLERPLYYEDSGSSGPSARGSVNAGRRTANALRPSFGQTSAACRRSSSP